MKRIYINIKYVIYNVMGFCELFFYRIRNQGKEEKNKSQILVSRSNFIRKFAKTVRILRIAIPYFALWNITGKWIIIWHTLFWSRCPLRLCKLLISCTKLWLLKCYTFSCIIFKTYCMFFWTAAFRQKGVLWDWLCQ